MPGRLLTIPLVVKDDRGVAVMFAIASKGDDSAEWFVLWAPLHLFPPYKSDQG